MHLDSESAKALFAVVLTNTQGADTLKPQLPLHVFDRGASWLVVGTPYSDSRRESHYRMCNMFFSKRTAEVEGIDCHARMALTDAEKLHWTGIMTAEQFSRVFGPPTHFEPQGVGDIWLAAYGGVVNTPEAAAHYAAILTQTQPARPSFEAASFHAEERDGVWHITGPRVAAGDILTISRATGRVLSGKLVDGTPNHEP